MTTALSRCHECSALLPDNPDDRRAHLGYHRDVSKKLEAQRTRVGALSSDVIRLVNDVAAFRRTLDSHPITADPTEITVNDIPDDEIDEYEDESLAGEPDEDAATQGPIVFTRDDLTSELDTPVYPAIDRDDDLDARLANATGAKPTI